MSATPSTAPADRRRLRCRLGLHRWVLIKHADADLANPQEGVEWKATCRYCGVEHGSGLASIAILAGMLAVAGGLLWWLVSPLLGALVLAGAVMGIGWAGRMVALSRVDSFGVRFRG